MGEANKEPGDKPRSAKADSAVGTPLKFEGLAELAGHVFISGVGQADKYRKTTDAIAEYAGQTIMDEMHALIITGEDATFPEPPELDDADAVGAKLEKYRILLKMALDKQDKYETAKGLTFRLILGQCTVVLQGKVESDATFKDLQKAKDVAGIMKLLEERGVQLKSWRSF